METHNISWEPMDIDTSGHSAKEMDISYNEMVDFKPTIKAEKTDVVSEKNQLITGNKQDHPPIVKKYHINMQKPTKSSKNVVFQILSAVIIIFISILTLHVYSLKCCDDFDLEELRNSFTSKLYGQSEAINTIIRTLEIKDTSKLLLFSGGTGVGKTLASYILLDSVGSCSNVYHYTMPSFSSTFSTDFMYGLTMCKKALIVVDDLTANDMNIKKQIKEVIEQSEHLGKDITVILIYNCHESTQEFIRNCDESFHKRLLDNFAEIKALKRIVSFKPLTETDLKKCIEHELGDKHMDSKDLDEVLKNFNVTVDGCKGVHSKMKYLNIV